MAADPSSYLKQATTTSTRERQAWAMVGPASIPNRVRADMASSAVVLRPSVPLTILGDMDASLWLGIAASVISVIALMVSAQLALRQTRLMRHANHMPAVIDLLSQFRSVDFNNHHRYVVSRLNQEHQPDGGISGLPDNARAAVYDVVYFYQTFATLVALGILGREATIAILRHRITQVWQAVAPFVVQERQSGLGGPYLLRLLETLATHAAASQSQRH